jgi:hypothetical protein
VSESELGFERERERVRSDARGHGWGGFTRDSQWAVPAQLAVPCLGRPYGLNWWPRHDTIYESCPALTLKGTCRAVPVPCFLVSCPGRPTVLVSFGQLYLYWTYSTMSCCWTYSVVSTFFLHFGANHEPVCFGF